jgi:Helix-turn-helix domain
MSWAITNRVWELAIDDMGGPEKVVLLCLARHADAEGKKALPSIATIARQCRLGERTVQRALRDAERRGFIIPQKRGGSNRHGRWTTEYMFDLQALDRALAAQGAAAPPPVPEQHPSGAADDSEAPPPVPERHPSGAADDSEAPPPVPERHPKGGGRGGGERFSPLPPDHQGAIEWTREALIEVAKTCGGQGNKLNLKNATLQVDGALKTIGPEELASVYSEQRGRTRDVIQTAINSKIDQATRRRVDERERQIMPVKSWIDALPWTTVRRWSLRSTTGYQRRARALLAISH